jgi:uncharacterized Zn finger protein
VKCNTCGGNLCYELISTHIVDLKCMLCGRVDKSFVKIMKHEPIDWASSSSRRGRPRGMSFRTQEKLEAIKKLVEQGAHVRTVQEQLGCSYNYAYRLMKYVGA